MGKNDIISIDKVEYQKWLQNLCDEIDRQRLKAVMQLNASTLQHYWWLGNDILKKQDAQGWGAKVIDMLSTDLMKRYGNDSGYSIRNLKYMRQFAVEYPDFPFVQVPLAQLRDNQVLEIENEFDNFDNFDNYNLNLLLIKRFILRSRKTGFPTCSLDEFKPIPED